MYDFVTHTWNVIKGKCEHDCIYCYMKQFKQNSIRFDEKELKADLGKNNFIFVGSSTDMWAENIPCDWIQKIIIKCSEKNSNTYLFQSKNPKRFINQYMPSNIILGTTIETNRSYNISKAPSIIERIKAMINLKYAKKMITIEPILDFDIES